MPGGAVEEKFFGGGGGQGAQPPERAFASLHSWRLAQGC